MRKNKMDANGKLKSAQMKRWKFTNVVQPDLTMLNLRTLLSFGIIFQFYFKKYNK